jgi:uncharacterized membrane protein YhaH (DUF805 family)
MFKHLFSFKGRMRRRDYWISAVATPFVTFILFLLIITGLPEDSPLAASLLLIVFGVGIWYEMAENTKRCHDLGRSGWWQLIPFYGFALLFARGQEGPNEYGPDPKANDEIEKVAGLDMKRPASQFDVEMAAIRLEREKNSGRL